VTDRTGWRKSSFSANDNQCVEVPQQRDALRDSKNPAGPIVPVARASFIRLISALKADQFPLVS
jgi:hypothetical protein